MKRSNMISLVLCIFFVIGCNNINYIEDDTIKDTIKEIPVKYSDSIGGCIGEGYHLITPGIEEEWKTRRNLTCCEGLIAISEAEYPRLFDNDCNAASGTGDLCSNCGNGICEKWESKCSCSEDCK
ncbi:MAG: hypothetical protein ABIJ08_05165 [Nanoarchaeota archaeon]